MAILRPLTVERLEDRCVPATIYGNPWPDAEHLTLSFAPDGTMISGQPSNLDATLDPLGNTAAKLQILRAFQTWAVTSNINIGVVADDGEDFGTAGAIQGDPRFGDVRIGARPLGDSVVAVTAPFNLFGTSSGDSALNSSQPISIGGANSTYDLYTIYLHEAGHAFGLPDTDNATSVMYDDYQGVYTGLSPIDIANLQAQYGVRTPEPAGNASIATATPYKAAVEGDIATNQDVDYYRFSLPLLSTGTTIQVNSAGLSLLEANVQVVDAAGNVYATAAATDPLHNNLTLNLNNLNPLGQYYVRVSSGSNDVFGIGSYQLNITQHTLLGDLVGKLDKVLDNTLATATTLVQNLATADGAYNYRSYSNFISRSDVDYYQVTVPPTSGNQPVNLVAVAWSLNGAILNPQIAVFDSSGQPVAAEILTNDGGSYVVQVANVQPGTTYFLEVSSSTQSVGNYSMSVAFPSQQVVFPMGAIGTLSASQTQTSADLNVVQSQQFHFLMDANSNQQTGAVIQLTIRNSQGQIIFQMQTTDGDTTSGDIILDAGVYNVVISVIPLSGQAPPTIGFSLAMIGITEPIGVDSADSSGSSDGGNAPPSGGSSPPSSDNGTTWSTGSEGDGTLWY